MTAVAATFLDALKAAADHAEAAEAQYRKEAARQLAAVEQARTFAFRRLNLMRAVSNAMAPAQDEETAVAGALAVLREKVGWGTDSDARSEVLSRFTPVVQAVYRALDANERANADAAQSALAGFENWYAGSHQAPFWTLFDQYYVETPRVDF